MASQSSPCPFAHQQPPHSKCCGLYSYLVAKPNVAFICLLYLIFHSSKIECICAIYYTTNHGTQFMNPSVLKLQGIPIAVIHRADPCIWELKTTRYPVPKADEQPRPAPCFLAKDIAVPFVEWKPGIRLPGPPPSPQYHDALTVREQFMGLKTEKHFLDFLNRIGRFSSLPKAENHQGWLLSELEIYQQLFGEFSQRPPDMWNEYVEGISPKSKVPAGIKSALWHSTSYKVEFRWKSTLQPKWLGANNLAVIETTDAISSILATITIDHLRGARLRACARKDCSQIFEITSRHKRKYCSNYCGHLVSVRRTRKRQRRKG